MAAVEHVKLLMFERHPSPPYTTLFDWGVVSIYLPACPLYFACCRSKAIHASRARGLQGRAAGAGARHKR